MQSELTGEEKVSILIPTYNREKYIEETIFSALNQTYKNIEVIVVDNCSSDNTYQICQKIASKDARLLLYKNSQNIGPVKNWIECLKKSSGEYVKILWSDDLIHPEYLSKTIHLFKDGGIGFVYTQTQLVDSDGVCSKKLYSKRPTGKYPAHEYLRDILFSDVAPVSPGCAVYRRQDVVNNLRISVKNSLGIDFSIHAIGNDLQLYLDTSNSYSYYYIINEALSTFRAHEDSISIKEKKAKLVLYYDIAKISYLDTYGPKNIKNKFCAKLCIHWIKYMREAIAIGIKFPHYFNKNKSFNFYLSALHGLVFND